MDWAQATTTSIGVVAGPAGVALGWWLNQRGADKRDAQARLTSLADAELHRALASARIARLLATSGRDLAHAIYMQSTNPGGKVAGFREMNDDFNGARSEFRLALLTLRVEGPSWAVGPAEKIEVKGQQLVVVMGRMQNGLRAADVEKVQVLVTDLDNEVDTYVQLLSDHYNPDAPALPDRPDLDVVGRVDE